MSHLRNGAPKVLQSEHISNHDQIEYLLLTFVILNLPEVLQHILVEYLLHISQLEEVDEHVSAHHVASEALAALHVVREPARLLTVTVRRKKISIICTSCVA